MSTIMQPEFGAGADPLIIAGTAYGFRRGRSDYEGKASIRTNRLSSQCRSLRR